MSSIFTTMSWKKWLILVLAIQAGFLTLLTIALVGSGKASFDQETWSTSTGKSFHFYLAPVGDDSWGPMIAAYRACKEADECRIYDVFLKQGVKFQYPPSALLPLELLPSSLLAASELDPHAFGLRWSPEFKVAPDFSAFSTAFAWLCFLATLFATWQALRVAQRLAAKNTNGPMLDWQSGLIVVLLGFIYYPLSAGMTFGQIQILVDLLVALAVGAFVSQNHAVSGVCIGLCCLIKPQYALMFVWAVVRRHYQVLMWALVPLILGTAVSAYLYGWKNYLQYLQVLSVISHGGEAYWPNQSLNGVLNRWFDVASSIDFEKRAFPPYHPIVYASTVLSSVALVAWALIIKTPQSQLARVADFLLIIVVATLASPIAWEHHYGVMFPVFLCAAMLLLPLRPLGKFSPLWLALGYFLTAEVLLMPNLFVGSKLTELELSSMYFGGLLLMAFLFLARRQAINHQLTS